MAWRADVNCVRVNRPDLGVRWHANDEFKVALNCLLNELVLRYGKQLRKLAQEVVETVKFQKLLVLHCNLMVSRSG